MKRTILGTFILAVIVAAGTLGAVAATDEEAPVSTGIPSLCEQAHDQAAVQVLKRGHSLTQPHAPTFVVSNEAGNCVATFDWRLRNSPIEATFIWGGEPQITVEVDPEYVVKALGFNYAFEAVIKADGSFEFTVPVPTRQIWWCGIKIGECHLTTGDAYFSPECIAASHDPEYLKLYKPGTGPACVAHTYEKLESGEVVIVE